MNGKLSTGSECIDNLLGGGYEKGIITTFFGESGSGKSNVCILAALTAARQAKKVAYIDTEGGFSVERATQLFPRDYKQLMENIIFFNPTSFEEQSKVFDQVKETVSEGRFGLIIVDSIVMLYRLKLGMKEDIPEVNRELARQLRVLSEIARKKDLPVIVTNQVYSDFGKENDVRMVGGDLLKYWSKAVVKLAKDEVPVCRASIYKHRSQPAGREIYFEIRNSGIFNSEKPKKKFKLF